VRRNVRILRRLEVGAPPVAEGVLHLPVGRGGRLATERLEEQALEPARLVLAGLQLAAGQLEEGGAELEQEDVRQTVLVDQ
jgi:hypothetical protein